MLIGGLRVVKMLIVKVKKFGVGWCIPHEIHLLHVLGLMSDSLTTISVESH
jgi:hypothetical protein